MLRKDLTSGVAVTRVSRRRKRKRRRVKTCAAREKERRKNRKKRMSFPLKKSRPNKGALFHAQCSLPQTRSLRYLSLRGARCSFTLLSTVRESLFLSLSLTLSLCISASFFFLFLSRNPREWRIVSYRVMLSHLQSARGDVIVARNVSPKQRDNFLISLDTL